MPQVTETYFDERLTVAVPGNFRDSVRAAATSARLTMADYVRSALSQRMVRDGVAHPALPTLSHSGARREPERARPAQ